MYRNFSSRETIEEINLEDILNHLQLTHEQFVELCILLGTDYNHGIKGMKPHEIYEEYLKHKNIPSFLHRIDELNIYAFCTSKPIKYIIPDDLRELWVKIKDHFMNVRVVEPSNLNFQWKCPKYEELYNLLITKYKFEQHISSSLINSLKKSYNNHIKKTKRLKI